MTKHNIVLFCENNHFDALTLAAEEAVLHKLDKHKWTTSFRESNKFLDTTEIANDISEIDLQASYLLNISPENLCFRNSVYLKQMFANSFTSYDFDVDSSNRNDLFNEMSMCPKLDALHSALTDSEFFGILTEQFYVDQPVDVQRNKDVVKNLENLSMHVTNNYTIGWAGQAHCVDFHHHLTEANSPLLEKIKFININSQCSKENLVTPESFTVALGKYFFSDCINDPRVSEIYQRALQFIDYPFFNDIDTPQEKLHALWEEDFIKSSHVLDVHVSISDEPGSILPWQLADLEIFN